MSQDSTSLQVPSLKDGHIVFDILTTLLLILLDPTEGSISAEMHMIRFLAFEDLVNFFQ